MLDAAIFSEDDDDKSIEKRSDDIAVEEKIV